MHNNKHLNGWKEIGSYLGRVVRTAQRWEAQLGMPVHRPATRKRTAVIAFPHELDTWLVANRSRLEAYESHVLADSVTDIADLREKVARLQAQATQLALELQRAYREIPQLLETHSAGPHGLGESPD